MKEFILEKLAGNYRKEPSATPLGWEAEELVARAFDDIPEGGFIDCHVHLAGLRKGGTGCWVNPEVFSLKHPLDKIKINTLIHASGIEDLEQADQQYLQRLRMLVNDFPEGSRFMLLAMDKVYDKSGEANMQDTKLYIPNDYMYEVYLSAPDRFIPCISIHPYRKDAVVELEKWAKKGVRAVKWLPNEMGMDPSDSLCEPFYEKMAEYDMVLLGHAGRESAIEVIKFKPFGNPLFYRKPLEMRVKVIMAHCASLGTGIDVESSWKKPVKNYKLFLRLMEEERYQGLLFADISAIVQINRMGAPLKTVMEKTNLHHRLINGSDYPLPAVNASIWTSMFQSMGFIKSGEKRALNQIYKRNPLLFDFVLKRCLRSPGDSVIQFPASVFQDHPQLALTSSLVEQETSI